MVCSLHFNSTEAQMPTHISLLPAGVRTSPIDIWYLFQIALFCKKRRHPDSRSERDIDGHAFLSFSRPERDQDKLSSG
jgi:hypothetical protein